MCKKIWKGKDMVDAFTIEARDLSKEITRMISRGAGDTENAMRAAARKAGVAYGVLWALRYRPTKPISASDYFGLKSFYARLCAEQADKLKHEYETIVASIGADAIAARAARALVPEVAE